MTCQKTIDLFTITRDTYYANQVMQTCSESVLDLYLVIRGCLYEQRKTTRNG